MVVNSCFKDLEGGVGLKGVWEFVPEAGEKRNEGVKVSREPRFRQFNHQRVAGRSCATCRNIWGTEHRESWGSKAGEESVEDRKTTYLPALDKPTSPTADMSNYGMSQRLARQQFRKSGGGSFDRATPYHNQVFAQLQEECLQQGALFEDIVFPATLNSLGYDELGCGSPKVRGVRWKRPTEICDSPIFLSGGATRTDICQGALGDCWLLAAIASLTLNEKLLSRIVPQDQNFEDNYAGIFHFQFWQYGEWVDVVIDDRLPYRDEELLFVHSAQGNEFWSALLEKAYAKLNCSYEALTGGSTCEGFEDFTGGVTECINLDEPPNNLWRILREATKRGSLMGCSINVTGSEQSEAITSTQLVKGHAYSLTGIDEVEYQGDIVRLVRARNPWGKVEWTGRWSDTSSEWDDVSDEDKERLQINGEDGEFWMEFEEFKHLFSRLEVCNLSADALSDDSPNTWASSVCEDSWVKGSTAGGCRNFPNTFCMNPQFRLTLDEDDDDPYDGVDGCSALVALMQRDRRRYKRRGQELRTIGYTIYKVPEDMQGGGRLRLPRDFFLYNKSCGRSESFVNTREVSTRHVLPAGQYFLVPSTFDPNQDANFVLRMFTEKSSNTESMDDDIDATLPDPEPEEDPDIDPAFEEQFQMLAGADSQISANELKDILNRIVSCHPALKTDGFSIECCRSMVSLLDNDGSAKLGVDEFYLLWQKIKQWQKDFVEYDTDGSGFLSSFEVRTALGKAGMKLNNSLLQMVVLRFSNDEFQVDFDNYICCVVRLEAMFRIFKALDPDGSNTMDLNLAQFLLVTMTS
uniref:calpain-1 catalytic subunit-like isoform X2 n=1 Tax=Myxine glutinosa TaxID=7769 RepID=UPI00358FE25E